MGLACIPITAWHASVPLRAENIWKHSQPKHNLGQVPNRRENKPGSPGTQHSKVHWGTPETCLWCLCSSLCSVMGVLWREDIHLSADPTLCFFAISRDPLISAKDLSLSWATFLLSSRRTWCPSLKLNICTFQALIFSRLLKLVSSSPGSGFPVHPGYLERAHSPTETWTGTSAPRRGLFSLIPVLSHGPSSGTSFSQWKELSTCQRTVWAMHFTHWPEVGVVPWGISLSLLILLWRDGHQLPKVTLLPWLQCCAEVECSVPAGCVSAELSVT